MARVPALASGSVLARTEEGTRQMSARAAELAPKLRSVLFLVTGRISYGELLERAGSLRGVLDAQIQSLFALGLIEVVSEAGARAAPVASARGPNSNMLPDLPPVAGAKIQLLKRLEASGSSEATLLADELLSARTLRELAERARDIARRIQEADGRGPGETFWNDAKDILTTWRDFASHGR
jgi:hypothetical protein